MIIDGHSHVNLPIEDHIAAMDKAGVDKTILFMTTIHPEKAATLSELKNEMSILDQIILSGKNNALSDARNKALAELKKALQLHPSRFIGFGSVPANLNSNDLNIYIEENIIKNNLVGLGEFTLPSGQIKTLTPIFKASMTFGKLPLWIHAFNPLGLQDIKEIADLAKAFPDVPVILGHMGGSNWLTAIELAKVIPNLYLDTSASFSTLILKIALNELPHKCIFGVDMPYGDLELSLATIKKLCHEPIATNTILGENIAKLLKL